MKTTVDGTENSLPPCFAMSFLTQRQSGAERAVRESDNLR